MSEDLHSSDNTIPKYKWECPHCQEVIECMGLSALDVLMRIHLFDHREANKHGVASTTAIVKQGIRGLTSEDIKFLRECGIVVD